MWNRPDPYLARHDTHKKAVPCDICSMEEAEMLFSPAVGRDAMVIEVVPVAYRPSEGKFFPPGSSNLMPTVTCGVRKAAGYSRYELCCMALGSGVGVRVAPGSPISRLLTLSLENYIFSDWDFSPYCAHCWSKLSLLCFPMAFSIFTSSFLYSALPKVAHARSSSQSHRRSTWSWVFLFIFSPQNPFSGPVSPASSTITTLHPVASFIVFLMAFILSLLAWDFMSHALRQKSHECLISHNFSLRLFPHWTSILITTWIPLTLTVLLLLIRNHIRLLKKTRQGDQNFHTILG